jgi:hypothetical protein
LTDHTFEAKRAVPSLSKGLSPKDQAEAESETDAALEQESEESMSPEEGIDWAYRALHAAYRTKRFRKLAALKILKLKHELEDEGEDTASFESDRKLELSRDILTTAMATSGFTKRFLSSRNPR